ncbi:MAG TPA: hypothetical protein VMG12_26820 [Polyangiaceae bacterium]|nr:hypothetical protein [Polyangiaceae bacterium]
MTIHNGCSALGFGLLIATLMSACSDAPIDEPSADEEQQIGIAQQPWSVVSCGRESTTPNVTFQGRIDLSSFTSPTSYNKCTKSYVVDVFDVAPDASGSGRDGNAFFDVRDAGPIPTNQADCEALEGGAIFYQRSGNAWVALTDQVVSAGRWAPGLFGGMVCFPPAVSFEGDGGLEEGASYRIAATYRNAAGVTRPIRFDHAGPVTVR